LTDLRRLFKKICDYLCHLRAYMLIIFHS